MKKRYTVPCVGLVGFGVGVLLGSGGMNFGAFAVGVSFMLGAMVLWQLVRIAAGVAISWSIYHGLERPGCGVSYKGQGR